MFRTTWHPYKVTNKTCASTIHHYCASTRSSAFPKVPSHLLVEFGGGDAVSYLSYLPATVPMVTPQLELCTFFCSIFFSSLVLTVHQQILSTMCDNVTELEEEPALPETVYSAERMYLKMEMTQFYFCIWGEGCEFRSGNALLKDILMPLLNKCHWAFDLKSY